MDFEALPEIKEALVKRVEHGIYGLIMQVKIIVETLQLSHQVIIDNR